MNAFLGKLQDQRNQKAALIDATLDKAAEESRDITDVETANVSALAKEIEKLDERIAQVADIETRKAAAAELARKVDGTKTETRDAAPTRVTSEPRTYSTTSPYSFIRDAFAAQILGDYEARARLERHQQEERLEKRDVGTSAFAGLVVPQFLTDLVAPLARAGRPVADRCRQHALPAQGMTLSISKITTGSAVASQTEGAAVQETDMDDTQLDLTVTTIAGQQNVSRQAMERGTGIDSIVMADLAAAYHTLVDSTLVAAAVSQAGQSSTYNDGSPTVPELYPKILDCIQKVQTTYFAGPNAIIMHPRRLAFILAAIDGSSRPLAVPTSHGPTNSVATGAGAPQYGNSGYDIVGLPVITDANVTTTSGGGTEDVILIGNLQELHLFESPNAPFMLRFEQPKSAELEVKVVVYGYIAVTANRYPNAWAKITGTGLVTPTF